ncbi:sensor histidine kinase [Archangium lansingense]|uniref:histidine kinase n=1 Tax=Archangium lansingense TaxID=2995310 RepID=A0ABT4AFB8_9BACT|nr:HAMP domain-containing sensor histidine kinase [Archangium lansinium]MCY1079582.1 HAMP domain-containing sensor histidine kinase [Archangium lansinium]
MKPSPASPPPSGLEQVQREAFARHFMRMARIRIYMMPPSLFILLYLLVQEPAVWRKWLLGGLLGLFVVVEGIELHHYLRRTPHQRFSFTYVIGVGIPIHGGLLLVTGGLEGPLTPVLLMVSFFISLFTTTRGAWVLALLHVATLWGLAAVSFTGVVPDLLPQLYGGGARAGHNDALLLSHVTVLSVLVALSVGIGSIMRDVFQGMAKDALDARDETLRTHTEALNALTLFSGEIAHELKNPLASVKGLAAMVARDVEGKPAERLAVLRREVDRMQEILEGFLNFSRPLLPLNEQRTSLGWLCQQVVELHEGMAGDRGVSLRLFVEQHVAVWCDPRKVKQVLINLVQNALEAAPRGSTVELVILPTPEGGGRVEVRDQGPGIAPEVRERVFEPGVTTKPKGNGLGLALARSLARQHGGELELHPREGGGCVAELVLPAELPPRQERTEVVA